MKVRLLIIPACSNDSLSDQDLSEIIEEPSQVFSIKSPENKGKITNLMHKLDFNTGSDMNILNYVKNSNFSVQMPNRNSHNHHMHFLPYSDNSTPLIDNKINTKMGDNNTKISNFDNYFNKASDHIITKNDNFINNKYT